MEQIFGKVYCMENASIKRTVNVISRLLFRVDKIFVD